MKAEQQADKHAIEQTSTRLANARSVLFLTGAGISADSGLPTYRGVGGLYDDVPTADGIPIEKALSGTVFVQNPALSWRYLWEIGKACRGAAPNFAHQFIASLEQRCEVTVLTQNVDGLHAIAGSSNLIEVHGNASKLVCTKCKRRFHASSLFSDYAAQIELPPLCPQCGGVIRPEVVLFEEMLFPEVLKALDAVDRKRFDVVICVGTTALFPYIQYPVARAKDKQSLTVEINPSDTLLSPIVDCRLRLGADEAARMLHAELESLAP